MVTMPTETICAAECLAQSESQVRKEQSGTVRRRNLVDKLWWRSGQVVAAAWCCGSDEERANCCRPAQEAAHQLATATGTGVKRWRSEDGGNLNA